VAVYVSSTLRSSRWTPSIAADSTLKIESAFIAALYHPPRVTYRPEVLLEFIETCVAEITYEYPLADIVLAGDLNQLSAYCDAVERTGFTQIVRQPTRGANILDRVFVSSPDLYGVVRVMTSVVRIERP
jgi:hypothetical protein